VTTGPGDEKAAAAAGRGHLRASHGDREQVIDTLKAAFVQGRLTKDEFDLRVGQAFASRTYSELATITADIPAGLTGARPLRGPARARRPASNAVLLGACVLIGPAALAAAHPVNNEGYERVLIGVVVVYFWAWLVAGAQVLYSRHQKRSRGRPPKRPAQRGRRLEGGQHGRIGNDLILCEVRRGARARRAHLTGRRDQGRPASQQVTA